MTAEQRAMALVAEYEPLMKLVEDEPTDPEAFIAEARASIPKLVTEVARLRDALNGHAQTRTVMSTMLQQLQPSVVVATMDRTYTAHEMAREVERGTEVGLQWASDFFRICRDMLTRFHRRKQD